MIRMASPVEQVTVWWRYAFAATVARTADAGAAVGVVLLAAGGAGGVRLGGFLAAALTAPHLLGGRIGRLVDRARDPRRPLAAGCVGYAAALATATGALRLGLPAVGGGALVVAGACGPLLTGGFSSLTGGLGGCPERARGIDTLTYGVSGVVGPAAVAGLAALTSPAASLLLLAGATLVAAVGTRWLPPVRVSTAAPIPDSRSGPTRSTAPVSEVASAAGGRGGPPRSASRVSAVASAAGGRGGPTRSASRVSAAASAAGGRGRPMRSASGRSSRSSVRASGGGRAVLLTVRPLRRVAVTTVVSAAAGGMLAVLAVVLAAAVTGRPADGAWLLGAMGLGNLVGSAALAVRPLTAEPVRATLVLTAALGVGYLLVALASGYALLLGAFAVVGVLTAPWITASLATRERHAPPGRRAEVFAGMAGWKMAAASAGTALAGLLAVAPARTVVAVAAAVVLGSALAMALDRPSAAPDGRPRQQALWRDAR